MLTNPKDNNIEKINKANSTNNNRSGNNVVSLESRRIEKRLSEAKKRVREAAGSLNW